MEELPDEHPHPKRMKHVFSYENVASLSSPIGVADHELPQILTKCLQTKGPVELLLNGNNLSSDVMPLLAAFIVESSNLQLINLIWNNFNSPQGFKLLINAAALNKSLRSMKLFSCPPYQHWSDHLENINKINEECQKGFDSHPAALCLKRYWLSCGHHLSFPPPMHSTLEYMDKFPAESVWDSTLFIVWMLEKHLPKDVILTFIIKKEKPIIYSHITNNFEQFTYVHNECNEYSFH